MTSEIEGRDWRFAASWSSESRRGSEEIMLERLGLLLELVWVKEDGYEEV